LRPFACPALQLENGMTCQPYHRLAFVALLLSLCLLGCGEKPGSLPKEGADTNLSLFRLLPASSTGVDFRNALFESDSLNILKHAYLYNGAGVGVGDFNNDGWVDLYFSANMVSNRLYLNQGNKGQPLQFADVTEAAGVAGEDKWCTGVSVVDINADGKLDIYVAATFHKDPQRRKNLLYINQGNNKEGVPVFRESAEACGLADTGYSTQAVFFDYDRDGDLDVYVLTNVLDPKASPVDFRPKTADGTALNNDRLYRNDTPLNSAGNGRVVFTNVTKQAGILMEGFGHAVSVTDVNLDGWPDLYVSNDFIANDLLYLNNRNGTFSNRIADYVRHTGWSVMGTDMSDINNDGLVDLIALEMLPENNLRKKANLSGNGYITYINSQKYQYEHQYIRNVLQLNRGMTPEGHPVFSEIAFMAGVYQTDWSWTPLVADFDNDGLRDMVITNGYPRDVTDLDYALYDNGQTPGIENTSLAMADSFPVVKIANYGFRNTNGLLFADSSKAWGLTHPSFSNGAAYADLDNDGDLDLVMNNLNDPAFIYENTTNQREQKHANHFLTVALAGPVSNPLGFGASLRVYYSGGQQQFYEHQPCRGYLSTMDARAHFGLGSAQHIDSVRVRWPDGKTQLLTNLPVDRVHHIIYREATVREQTYGKVATSGLLADATHRYGIRFRHREKDAIDYNIQRTLPHKFSQYGPGIAVGDVDNNGHDDFYIGGAAGYPGTFFMQDASGRFSADTHRFMGEENLEAEQMGVLLFDADGDRDLDLYVVSGSYEFPPYHLASQDRLYFNDGKGRFRWLPEALPKELSNGSCVRAADFDQDGDLDLFVGGRVVSGEYPTVPESYLLRNDGGRFEDVTVQYFPQLQRLGMITDALWSDYDQDGRVDLVLAGEWMPVTFYRNTGESFVSVNETTGIGQQLGWWNSLTAGDFDNDGDIDYVAGNLGLNSHFKASPEEPMTLFAKDLDENGRLDAMLFCYLKAEDGSRKPFPMHTRDDLVAQMPSLKKRYFSYHTFGRVSMDDLWGPNEREDALKMQANHMASSYLENQGNGRFVMRALPLEAQMAPVYGMVSEDVDGDGHLDLLLVGNDYGMEPFAGRHDAFTGLCLKGDGKGGFAPMSIACSGFFVKGDAKGLATVHTAKGEDLWLVSQNQDSLRAFGPKTTVAKTRYRWVNLQPGDFCADIVYPDQRKRRVEFYYGSTYLSQSSRRLKLSADTKKVVITNFKGQTREVSL